MKPLPPQGPDLDSSLRDLPRDGLLLAVRGYRLLLKPWLGSACRFEPTCSAYALVALQRHGALRGGVLAGWRLMRCHPWCDGGCDPVPAHFTLRRETSPPVAADPSGAQVAALWARGAGPAATGAAASETPNCPTDHPRTHP